MLNVLHDRLDRPLCLELTRLSTSLVVVEIVKIVKIYFSRVRGDC